jgi:4-hydroxymandelate oxidase
VYLRIEQRTFDAPAAYLRDPGHRANLDEYLRDLVRPYGLALRDGDLADGQSYGEMAEALIRTALPDDEPLDLLVLAFAVPDVRPGRATATYLSLVCPGNPMAFAVCDQGSAAAFTGLRLAREYARDADRDADRDAGGGRAAVLVLEQATLHHEPAAPVALPARPTAVALVCGPTGRARVDAVRQHAGVAPGRVAALLDAELAELSAGLPAGRDGVTVVLAGGLDPPPGYRARLARRDQPDTAAWSALAAVLDDDSTPAGRVLLANYDEALGILCVLATDR